MLIGRNLAECVGLWLADGYVKSKDVVIISKFRNKIFKALPDRIYRISKKIRKSKESVRRGLIRMKKLGIVRRDENLIWYPIKNKKILVK